MNIIISLIYAPLLFLGLKFFDTKILSIYVFIFALFWLLLTIKKDYKEILFPLFYMIISLITFFLEDFMVLKIMPLLISTFFAFILIASYLNKKSIILYFAIKFTKRFSKKDFSDDEKEYINKSTLFWFFIALCNIILHTYFFLTNNLELWAIYSSIGWYVVFIFGGILQITHKKLIFEKKNER